MNPSILTPVRSLLIGLGALVLVPVLATAQSTSSIITAESGYMSRDVVTNQSVSGGFTVANGRVYSWSNQYPGYVGFQIGNIATGEVQTIGQPSFPINSNGYGDPFGLYDAANDIFYAGTYNDGGASLYSYSNGTWTALGNFNSLYGADVQNGDVYVSGLNAIWTGGVGQHNQIALFDLSGAGNHDVLIHATGNSAYVTVDNAGNVYYANYNGGTPSLYRWSFESINLVRADREGGLAGGGIDDLYLTYDDAELLSSLPGGANGIAVDEGGNVFVTTNYSSEVVMWNESMGTGSGDNYVTIGTPAGFGWLGAIDTHGDFLNGGSIYVSNYGSDGLAEITQAVPEPSVYLLLAVAAGLVGFRKLRRGSRTA